MVVLSKICSGSMKVLVIAGVEKKFKDEILDLARCYRQDQEHKFKERDGKRERAAKIWEGGQETWHSFVRNVYVQYTQL